jgi:antitoxin component of MazEF toxin-antitoxin module
MQSAKNEYRKVLKMANGDSAGVCFPKQYLLNLSIMAGDFVRVRLEQERIIIEKADSK